MLAHPRPTPPGRAHWATLARDTSTSYDRGMAYSPPFAPIKGKSDEQESINTRDRALLASRQHLRDLIREHPARARDLIKAGLAN
jgi:hypothetical protein